MSREQWRGGDGASCLPWGIVSRDISLEHARLASSLSLVAFRQPLSQCELLFSLSVLTFFLFLSFGPRSTPSTLAGSIGGRYMHPCICLHPHTHLDMLIPNALSLIRLPRANIMEPPLDSLFLLLSSIFPSSVPPEKLHALSWQHHILAEMPCLFIPIGQ